MWKNALFLWAFAFGVSYVASVPPPPNWCPNPEYILPCRCTFPSYNIVCQDIDDIEALRQVAVNMEGVHTQFHQLQLINSSLQYLPKELLENVNVHELYMKNVSLVKVFDSSPSSQDYFEVITFEDVRLLRGVIWPIFKSMSHLKTITINDIPVSTLGKDFNDNVPHSLRQLEFRQTRTKKFQIGVFNGFNNLQKIDVYNCRLEELYREYFPVPFNVQAMYFGQNKLKSIPDDLFTQMPMLKDISLVGNQIATVPESAFGGRFNQLQSFLIRENPLKCDCSLKWIVRWKPFWYDGTCASPKIMHGKELKSLTVYDFGC